MSRKKASVGHPAGSNTRLCQIMSPGQSGWESSMVKAEQEITLEGCRHCQRRQQSAPWSPWPVHASWPRRVLGLLNGTSSISTNSCVHQKKDSSHRFAGFSLFSFSRAKHFLLQLLNWLFQALRERSPVPFISSSLQLENIEIPAFLIIQELCNTGRNIVDGVWHWKVTMAQVCICWNGIWELITTFLDYFPLPLHPPALPPPLPPPV